MCIHISCEEHGCRTQRFNIPNTTVNVSTSTTQNNLELFGKVTAVKNYHTHCEFTEADTLINIYFGRAAHLVANLHLTIASVKIMVTSLTQTVEMTEMCIEEQSCQWVAKYV